MSAWKGGGEEDCTLFHVRPVSPDLIVLPGLLWRDVRDVEIGDHNCPDPQRLREKRDLGIRSRGVQHRWAERLPSGWLERVSQVIAVSLESAKEDGRQFTVVLGQTSSRQCT